MILTTILETMSKLNIRLKCFPSTLLLMSLISCSSNENIKTYQQSSYWYKYDEKTDITHPNLLHELQNTKIDPIEYLLYQLFQIYQCQSMTNYHSLTCLSSQSNFDPESKTVYLFFKDKNHELADNIDMEKISINKIKSLILQLGIGLNRGDLQNIILKYDLSRDLLIDKSKIACIKVFLDTEISEKLIVSGQRKCNGIITVRVEEKLQAL